MKRKEQLINLYLEQIKYLVEEKISIQNQFLAGVNLPLVALGLLVYYIEMNIDKVRNIYLLLPFFYLFIPYNLIKFTIRILGINEYICYMEQEINSLLKTEVFMWNRKLINTSVFPGGFAFVTTLAQIPIHLVTVVFLIYKFCDTINYNEAFGEYRIFLSIALFLVLFGMILMLIDCVMIKKRVTKEINVNKNSK